MNRFSFLMAAVLCCLQVATAQVRNPWLDSTQYNESKAPVFIANGILVRASELNIDFIVSMNVVRDRTTNQWLGHLADNGCIYVKADQQFDVVTPRLYQAKRPVPASVRTVVFMLNGVIVPDTLRISKASIRKVDLLLSASHANAPTDSACLSIWILTDEERGLPIPTTHIRIRGAQHIHN